MSEGIYAKSVCPICQGRGKVSVAFNLGIDLPSCCFKSLGETEICRTCGGRGIIDVQTDKRIM